MRSFYSWNEIWQIRSIHFLSFPQVLFSVHPALFKLKALCVLIFSGNLATLRNEPNKMGIDTRQRLLDFHSRYYSAPLMTLCIVGKESLEDLKRCVESKFAPVLDRNVGSPPLKWWGSVAPYVEMLNREVKIPFLQVVPASEGMNYLTVSWYCCEPYFKLTILP